MSRHAIYVGGVVRVCADRCETCIFRPGNPMALEPGRVAGMVREANSDEAGSIVCHATLDAPLQAVCRGYFDAHRHGLLETAHQLGIIAEV